LAIKDHQGMHPDWPHRAFLNNFGLSSLNVMVIYWYPPRIIGNTWSSARSSTCKVMRAFEAEVFEFALPASTTYM
jgi:MscS family membrane protein